MGNIPSYVDNENVAEKSWDEFYNSNLLWLINRFLAVFGWGILLKMDLEKGKYVSAFPVRLKFDGYDIPIEVGSSRSFINNIAKNPERFSIAPAVETENDKKANTLLENAVTEAQIWKNLSEEIMRLADNGCTAKEIRKHLGYGDKGD